MEEIPRCQANGEIFGEYDAKNEKLAQAKARQIEASRYNKEKVEQRKREEILGQLRDQEVDSENIERMKEEYVGDSRFKSRVEAFRGGFELLDCEWTARTVTAVCSRCERASKPTGRMQRARSCAAT